MEYFNCKDVNGQIVTIEYSELEENLREKAFQIYGMGLSEIAEFRRQYMLRQAPLPITKEQIIKHFKQ